MDRHSLRRAAYRVVQSSEWLLLLFLVAAVTAPLVLRHHRLFVVPFDLLDGSWLVDVCYKAANGIWFGRDVAFTYGPLYQWLAAAPSRSLGVSLGTIFATAAVLPNLAVVLATFASARLLLPEVSPWRRAFLVLLAVIFLAPPTMRASISLLAFLLLLRIADVVASGVRGILLPSLTAAAICLVGFLVSADTGLYAFAALAISVAATLIVKPARPGVVSRLLIFSAASIAMLAALVIATNTVMFSPLNFTYWQSSLAIAAGYRWFEASPMMQASKHLLLGVLAFGVVVFIAAGWRHKGYGAGWPRRPAFLLAGFWLAFLMMQTALVRSDAPHLLIGVYPLVFFCGAILIGEDTSYRRTAVLLGVVVAGTAGLVWAFPQLLPSDIVIRPQDVKRYVRTCPAEYREFDRACFPADTAQLFTTVSAYVDQQTKPGDRIFVFPYQNVFGAISRRNVVGGVLQAYLVNGEYLTNLDVAGLRRSNPGFGLYLPDGDFSVALDGVPSLTRSPGLWFYLWRHYRLAGSPMPSVLGLVRDDSRDPQLSLVEEKIGEDPGQLPITKRSTTVDFGPIRWPSAGGDFLNFHFRANYPPWWKLRKPSKLSLQMTFADGSQKMIEFVAEPNRDTDVWVYPWDPNQIGSYFSGDETQWRSGNRPAITSLRVLITPFDWISDVPESINISKVDAVRLIQR